MFLLKIFFPTLPQDVETLSLLNDFWVIISTHYKQGRTRHMLKKHTHLTKWIKNVNLNKIKQNRSKLKINPSVKPIIDLNQDVNCSRSSHFFLNKPIKIYSSLPSTEICFSSFYRKKTIVTLIKKKVMSLVFDRTSIYLSLESSC